MSEPVEQPASKRRGWVHLLIAESLVLVAIFASYQLQRTLAVDVGSLWDIPFVSGFHADEPDIDYRYRWTKDHSEVVFHNAGSAQPVSATLWAQGARPLEVTQPVTMAVALNGSPLQIATLTQQLQPYAFSIAAGVADSSDYTVGIDTSTFRPPGDARDLGAKVARVELTQAGDGINWPPLWTVLWSLVAIAGLFGLFSPLNWRFPVLPYAGTALLCLFFLSNRLYAAAFIAPLGMILGLLGLFVWQRDRLRRLPWPKAVDAPREESHSARWLAVLMGVAMVVYALVALWTLPQVDSIGHADYAENAVIARNLVSGKGFIVDYAAQFYEDHSPTISHPADTWPLLQPLLIAPFIAILGSQTWAAKLPNLLLVLALAWAVFYVASRLWDARAGLLAGLLTLVHPYFFNAVFYPINDVAFTFIFFVLAWRVWGMLGVGSRESGVGKWKLVLIGLLAGLLIWSKPSGAVLLVGLVLWAFWVYWRRGPGECKLPWAALAWVGGAFAVTILPLVVRNLLAFGTPFFSTEGYDAWILRYWPLHDWEDIYKVYIGSELPHPRWIVGGKFGYQNLVDAVVHGFKSVWTSGVMNQRSGDFVIGPLYLLGALVGLAATPRRERNLFGMVGFSLGLYALFVLLYWHFEGRYFQVAVPWAYMLLAWCVVWVFDQLFRQFQVSGFRFQVFVKSLVLAVVTVVLLWPSLLAMRKQIEADIQPTGFVTGMDWLRENSQPDDVIMTRDPWELNWHTGRKAVMIPNDDLETIEQIARKYGVTMLQLGGPVDGIDVRRCPETTGSRPALGTLYCGQVRPGYDLLYRQGGLTVWRVTSGE